MRLHTLLFGLLLVLTRCSDDAPSGDADIVDGTSPDATDTTSPDAPDTTAPDAADTVGPDADTISPHAPAEVEASVALPAGSVIEAQQLVVETVFGEAAVAPTGGATIQIVGQGPQLTLATLEGEPVLAGFIGGSSVIDAHTTAEVMLFFHVGGFFHPAAVRMALLEALRTSDSTADLAAAIEDALRTDPALVFAATGPVAEAKEAATSEILAPMMTPWALRIEPALAQSGVSLLHEGVDTVKVMNEYRRRVHVFIDRISYEPVGGGAPIPDRADITDFRLSGVTGVTSVIGSISNWALGKVAYAPSISDGVSLPLDPEDYAESTLYRVKVIGLSLRYDGSLEPEELAAYESLFANTLLFDQVIPLVTSLLLPVGQSEYNELAGFDGAADASTDAISLLAYIYEESTGIAEEIAVHDSAALGKLRGRAFELAVNNSTFRAYLGRLAYKVLARFLPAHAAGTAAWAEKVMKILTVFDGVLTSGDILVQDSHYAASNALETWDVTATKSPVRVDPPLADLFAFEKASFTAGAGVDPDSVPLVYRWRLAEGRGTLKTSIQTGTDFETTSRTVEYIAPAVAESSSETVLVQVLELQGSDKRSLGEAKALVRLRPLTLKLVPRKVSLHPGEERRFVVKKSDDTPFAVGAEHFVFNWQVDPTYATFPTRATHAYQGWAPESMVKVRADAPEGKTRIYVEALVESPTDHTRTSLGFASADILVELRKTVMLGSFYIEEQQGVLSDVQGWVRADAYAIVPKAEDAVSYDIYLYNFNDTAYYGREIRHFYRAGSGLPSRWKETDDSIWVWLTGGGGTCNIGDCPGSGHAELVAWQTSRFAGIIVESTVTYR